MKRQGTKGGGSNPALSFEVRKAASDALFELAERMMRGANSLSRKASCLLADDPKIQGRAVGELRRYQGFKMPCSGKVLEIEVALKNGDLAESKKLAEQRRYEKRRADRAREERWKAESWDIDGWRCQETIRMAEQHVPALTEALHLVKTGQRGAEMVKTIAACLSPQRPVFDPWPDLVQMVRTPNEVEREFLDTAKANPAIRKALMSQTQDGNVVAGPWDGAS